MGFIIGNAFNILFFIIGFTLLFHTLILIKVIPYQITWGGRLKTDREMYLFEAFSILLNIILGGTLLMKSNFFSNTIPGQVVDVILWVFLGLFILNSIGNLFAKTIFEKALTIITALLAFLIWHILRY